MELTEGLLSFVGGLDDNSDCNSELENNQIEEFEVKHEYTKPLIKFTLLPNNNNCEGSRLNNCDDDPIEFPFGKKNNNTIDTSWRAANNNNNAKENGINQEPEVEVKRYNRSLFALGFIDRLTDIVKITISSLDFNIKTLSCSLLYRNKLLFPISRETEEWTMTNTIEFALFEFDLHVLYKECSLHYGFVFQDKLEAKYESKFDFKVPFYRENTQFRFSRPLEYLPTFEEREIFASGFKLEDAEPSIQQKLMDIDLYCRMPLCDRPYEWTLEILRTALMMEDLESRHDLERMNMENVTINKVIGLDEKKNEFIFEMNGKNAKILKANGFKEVFLRIGAVLENVKTNSLNDQWSVSGRIKSIIGDVIKFTTSKRYALDLVGQYDIKFERQRSSTRANMNVIETISSSMLPYLKEFAVLPTGWTQEDDMAFIPFRFSNHEFIWFNPQIGENAEQQNAIKNILNCTSFPFPYVIFGPPGTGKTSTLVECVTQISTLNPKDRVLITAQSNSACDEIGKRLLKNLPDTKILRLYSTSLSAEKMKNLEPKLVATSNLRDENETNYWPSKEEFGFFKIVIVTLMGSNRLVQSDIEDSHFEYIFLDECGAASEPESLVPLLGLGTNRQEAKDAKSSLDSHDTKITANIVILGDYKQLGAVISSSIAEQMGLGISLMERLMTKNRYKPKPEYDTYYVTQLLDNYRCHPAILQFSSAQFYDFMLRPKVADELRQFAEKWELLPNLGFPILFHCTKEASQVVPYGTSSFNQAEVKHVKFYVEYLLNRGINGKQVIESDIGIVCPYNAQIEALRDALGDEIEIGTVEYFQGREKKIIVISTVKSGTGIGFLRNERRLNVMLTRAQSLLIVVGNPETLQKDPLWRSFVHYCHFNNAFGGETFNLMPLPDDEEIVVNQMISKLIKGAEEVMEKRSATKMTPDNIEQRLKNLEKLMMEL